MRRLVALFLLFVVPLQFAWSAVMNMDDHLAHGDAALGFHFHHDADHPHQGDATDAHDDIAGVGSLPQHNDDHHHCGHWHPVFTLILIETAPPFAEGPGGNPPLQSPASFVSHILIPLDRPPLTSL